MRRWNTFELETVFSVSSCVITKCEGLGIVTVKIALILNSYSVDDCGLRWGLVFGPVRYCVVAVWIYGVWPRSTYADTWMWGSDGVDSLYQFCAAALAVGVDELGFIIVADWIVLCQFVLLVFLEPTLSPASEAGRARSHYCLHYTIPWAQLLSCPCESPWS